MTVHAGWSPGSHGWGERLRSLVLRLERLLAPELVTRTYDDAPDPTSWGVEPFPVPAAGSGHVRVLGTSRSPAATG